MTEGSNGDRRQRIDIVPIEGITEPLGYATARPGDPRDMDAASRPRAPRGRHTVNGATFSQQTGQDEKPPGTHVQDVPWQQYGLETS